MAFSEFLLGKRERMNWIVETSYGAGGTLASGEVVGKNTTIEPDFNQGWQEILTAGADNLYIQDLELGPLILPYKMNFAPVNWRWLKYLMAVSDGDDSGTKTHTFTQRNSILSYRLEWAKRHTTNHVITLVGNVAKSGTLSFQRATGEGSEGLAQVALDCVAQDLSEGSTVASVSAITKDSFMFRHVKVTIDGTEYKEVNEGEMTISVGIDENDSRYCNTTYDNLLGEPIPKVFRITGRFNINIKDKTLYDLWAAGTAVSGTCSLLLDKDGTGNDQILFTFANFHVFGAVASTNLEGVTNVDVVFGALSFSSVVARDDITTY